MKDLINKYDKILFDKGIDVEKISYSELLNLSNINFDDSWYRGLNKWDYMIGILSGSIGALIPNISFNEDGAMSLNSSSSWMREEGSKFHDNVSKIEFKDDGNYLNKIFSHKGDNIDAISASAKSDSIPFDMHRLYSGHDFFQFSKDNVFYQMQNQYGFIGILKSFIHLFYDFTSKRGLPLPGTSNFSSTVYNDWCQRSPEIYEQYVSMNIRDLSSYGITAGLLKSYRFLDSKFWSKREHSHEIPLYYRLNMLAYSANIILGLAANTLNPFSVVAFSKACFNHQMMQWNRTKCLSQRIDQLYKKTLSIEVNERSVDEMVSRMELDFEKFCKEDK